MNATATPLSMTDLNALERESWIDAATAEAFGLYRVNSTEGAALVGRTDREDYEGIVFPIYWPGEARPKEYFLRREHPPLEQRSDGTQKAIRRYMAPPGRRNRLVFGPDESAEVLADPAVPLVLVEGLKKTVAAWRLSRHDETTVPFLACGITGVWNWKGIIGKAPDATGTRVDWKGVIPDFDRVTWTDRAVTVLFDSDTATNQKVSAARKYLVKELRRRGAVVTAPDLPTLDGLDKAGFDDLLAHWGPARVDAWLLSVEETPPTLISLDDVTLPHLPIDAFPDALGQMIAAVARTTETPVELAGMIGLATVAACCQKHFLVEGEPGYTEPLSLWTVAALESGNRKSAVFSAMTAPLVRYEQAAKVAGHDTRTAKESERLTSEATVKALRAKAASSADIADRKHIQDEILKLEMGMPRVPTIPRLWAQDVTPEKLAGLMADNDEALALLSDEGGLFDMMGGRYSNGIPNLDLYLQGHAGTAVRVDRKSGPPVDLQRSTLTIGISPQPSVLRGLTAQEGFRGRGLLARFLYAMPASPLGYRNLHTVPVPQSVAAAYTAMCEELLGISDQRDSEGRIIMKSLRLSPEAHAEWKAFGRHVEGHLRPGGEFEYLKDWAGKLPGAV